MLCRQTIRLIPKKHIDVLTSSTANWTWPAVREIAEMKHVPFRLTPAPLNLTQRALCELSINVRNLSKSNDPKRHVDISGAMAKLGIKDLSDRDLLALVKRGEAQQYLALIAERENVRLNLERFVAKLHLGLRAKRHQRIKRGASGHSSQGKKVLDTFAWTIATICGFDEDPLIFTATGLDDLENGHEVRLFNKPVAVSPDLYVVRNSQKKHPDSVLIVFEDACGTTVPSGEPLAQIVADCLNLHYQNMIRCDLPTAPVYCMRLVNCHYIQFFALHCTKAELQAICLAPESTKKSINKLKLVSHDPNPENSYGLDLLDSAERLEAMKIAAALRNAVL